MFLTTFRSTKSHALNSLSLHPCCISRRSSNKFNYSTINSAFLAGVNLETRALHKFISAGMTASAPYVRENEVFPMDLLGVVRYAHRTLGNSSAYRHLAPSNLFFNPFTMALLVASAWPLLCGYAGVEYLFLMPRLLQNSWKLCYQTTTHYLRPETLVPRTSSLCFSIQTS